MSLVLLHTADWHLGKTLHGASLHRAHSAFAAWLVELVVEREVDVVLVAGDVFDRSVPPAQAEEVYYSLLAELGQRAPGVSVVVVAGNHDGPARLAAPAPMLGRLGVTVVGGVPVVAGSGDGRAEPDLAALVVPLRRRDGTLAGQLVAMPFLRPSDLSLVDLSGPGAPVAAAGSVAAGRALYERATEIARARNRAAGGGALVASGHGHVRGARLSPDSERALLGGDDAALPVDVFPSDLDYVALGHLHLAQALGPGGRVRYAGAPIPLAFSERAYPHQVVLVQLGAGAVRAEEIPVPRALELRRVAGPAGEALTFDEAIAALHAEGAHATTAERWVQVRVRLDGPRPALKRELAAALEQGARSVGAGAPPRLVHVDVERPAHRPEGPVEPLAWPELTPRAVLSRAWASTSEAPVPEPLVDALEQAWRDVLAFEAPSEGA
ncbi:MAG: exonuclease SbcCD subunit D C-terminal domain-containing protein [Sandaracinaceae bacterium]